MFIHTYIHTYIHAFLFTYIFTCSFQEYILNLFEEIAVAVPDDLIKYLPRIIPLLLSTLSMRKPNRSADNLSDVAPPGLLMDNDNGLLSPLLPSSSSSSSSSTSTSAVGGSGGVGGATTGALPIGALEMLNYTCIYM